MIQSNKPRPSLIKKASKAGKLLATGMKWQHVAKRVKSDVKTLKRWAAYFNWQLPVKLAIGVTPVKQRPLSKTVILQQARQQKLQAQAEQCNQVKKLLEAGSTQPAVRTALNLTYHTFYKHLKQLRILPDALTRATKKEQARQLYELEEMQPAEIEQELGLKPGSVQEWVWHDKWTNDQPTIFDLKWKARQLYEVKGMQQKEIAKHIGVSEKAVSSWSNKEKWIKPATKVQQQARQLYMAGTSQKEIAKQIGVSERTIGQWKKQNKWHRPGQPLPADKEPKK